MQSIESHIKKFWESLPQVKSVELVGRRLTNETEYEILINGEKVSALEESFQRMVENSAIWEQFIAYMSARLPTEQSIRRHEAARTALGEGKFYIGSATQRHDASGYATVPPKGLANICNAVAASGYKKVLDEISLGFKSWHYQGINRYGGHGQCLVAVVDGTTYYYYKLSAPLPMEIDKVAYEISKEVGKSGQDGAAKLVSKMVRGGRLVIVGIESAIDYTV